MNDGSGYESHEKAINGVEFAEMRAFVNNYLKNTYIIAYFQGNIKPDDLKAKETLDNLTVFYFKNV